MPTNKNTRNVDRFQAPDGTPFEVTAEGSLSLLAIGYRGLMAWRAKRIEASTAKGKAEPLKKP